MTSTASSSTVTAAIPFGRTERAAVQPSPGVLRLTARGRLVALIVLAVLVLGALTALGGRSSAAGIGAGVRSTEVVVVEPGQTLWDIAVALDPATDPRATIEQIVQLNGLPGTGSLQIGQRLAVPRR